MKQYTVTGMSCAACSARVEKAVKAVPGVTSCAVSLLTNSMGVEGNADSQEIIKAVVNAGYGANEKGQKLSGAEKEDPLKDTNSPILAKRLIWSLAFLLILLYFSMGSSMLKLPLPKLFDKNLLASGIVQMLLAAIVMVINQKFFISGIKGLIHRAPNMDTLVALGSGVSFVYSFFVLLDLTQKSKDMIPAMADFYFEGAAMILTLITVGKLLESLSKGKTTSALKALMNLAPKTAVILKDGKEIQLPVEEVKKDDIFIVRPGDNIPVDGIVIEGSSAVNESALTGESIPVDKEEGSRVSAATVNMSGFLKCRAEKVGLDTTLSQIIKMVSDAAATKAPIAKTADKISGIFVPSVIAISIITFLIWIFAKAEFSFALSRAIGVLVVSCPCALGLATPVAIMVGNGKAARNGILFKTSAALEESGRITGAALDKTGTLTRGQPIVTDIIPSPAFSEEELLQVALDLESKSEHPLAKAIVTYAEEKGIKAQPIEKFTALPGKGLRGEKNGKKLLGASVKFILQNIKEKGFIEEKAKELALQGKTPLAFAVEEEFAGLIAVADVLKEDSLQAVQELNAMGIKTIMLTGDNEITAAAISGQAGIKEVIAGLLPDGKEKALATLCEKGKTAMVGDGINDAPALTRASLGIAIGSGTDIAIDAADVVLMKGSLLGVSAAIKIGRATLKNIKENLFWAFFYNALLIPLAAGAYYKAFGLVLNPMLCAAAMSLSSFCVVTNALRLNLVNLRPSVKNKGDGKINIQTEVISMAENNVSEKVIKIEGMMCPHCEAHVKEALEKIEGVTEACPSHKEGQAIVKLSKDIDNKVLAAAVEQAGYKVVG